jgi:hypothetical protein
MEMNRKELEQLLRSVKPAGLSDATLLRLEEAMSGTMTLEAPLLQVEAQLQDITPRALSEATLERMMVTVKDVPFALDQKVLLFPGSHKEASATAPRQQGWRRVAAVAAVAMLGGLAALWTPSNQPAEVVSAAPITRPAAPAVPGIVATSFGTGIERAEDEGVIWTDDRQPKRVLRFEYQDRVLVRDKDGVDRMLFIPREELFVVPEKVD